MTIIRKYNVLYTNLFFFATVFFLLFYNINVNADTNVDNISFGSSMLVMNVGDTKTLQPIITPTNASNKKVSWISTNKNIASVDSAGNVIAKNYGYAKIIAITEDGNKKAVISLAIINKINVVFHRNLDSNDSTTVLQSFSLGNSYDDKTKKVNRFGYNVDGTEGNKKVFNDWNASNPSDKSIIGWTTNPNSNEKKYSLYSSVSDEWIENVLYNISSVQKKQATIDLYAVWGENVDLALFWGQSNMLGSVGKYKEELEKDKRIPLNSLIDKDIINRYDRMNHVEVNTVDNTVFEFKIKSNGAAILQDIKASNKIINDKGRPQNEQNTVDIGEKRSYSSLSTNNLKYGYINENRYSLEKSYGTNMIPEFGKTYYEKTKHKLVAVMAANGGEQISNFLPHCKSSKNSNCTNNVQYIYEALKAKYLAAVRYLESNGYYVKNKFYVVYQGEADSNKNLSSISKSNYKESHYYSTFMKVHNNLVKDLNISFGAIVFTGGHASDSNKSENFNYVKKIHTLQSRLINDNDNIISGSSLGYKAYTNCLTKNNCSPISYIYSSHEKNNIHLTSAALSQIGRETAMRIINSNKIKN